MDKGVAHYSRLGRGEARHAALRGPVLLRMLPLGTGCQCLAMDCGPCLGGSILLPCHSPSLSLARCFRNAALGSWARGVRNREKTTRRSGCPRKICGTPAPKRWLWSHHKERSHHLVVLVLEDVAVPHEKSCNVKLRPDGGDRSRVDDHRVLPTLVLYPGSLNSRYPEPLIH